MVRPIGGDFSALQFESVPPMNPHSVSEDFLLDAYLAQREAAAALPDYHVELTGLHPLKDPETMPSGAQVHQELAEFRDESGLVVRREVTIAEPDPRLPDEAVSPYTIIGSDSWTTGPSGLNRYKIKQYVDIGYPVIWVHHAGRHSPLQRDKSISRSAHQEHVLLDHIGQHTDFDMSAVIGDGYSRGAMIREKFIALAARYGRSVPYSDLEAPCFARDMSRLEKGLALLRQLPAEALGLAHVGKAVVRRAIETDNPELVAEYLGTLDLNPRNVWQEGMWAPALIRSKVGEFVEATPVEMQGVRTFYTRDHMSQQSAYRNIYDRRPNIRVDIRPGHHVEGATPTYIDNKCQRLIHLLSWMQISGRTLDGFKIDDIYVPVGGQPERKLQLIA